MPFTMHTGAAAAALAVAFRLYVALRYIKIFRNAKVCWGGGFLILFDVWLSFKLGCVNTCLLI